MAEDKQLTVAELLARAREQNPDGAKPEERSTRRRRRNLEDGGVSVAELTGSFKAVQATPAEAKHSSVPLDEPAEKPAASTTKANAPKTETPKNETPTDDAQADSARGANTSATKASDAKTAADKSEADKSEAKATDAKKAEDAKPAESKPADAKNPAADDQSVDATKPADAKKAEEKPAAPAPSTEDTGVIGKVTDEPKAAAGTAEKSGKTETTSFPAAAAASSAAAAGQAGQTGSAGDSDETTTDVAEDTTREADTSHDEENSGRTNIGAVILLAILGVVIGIVVFLLFQFMWARLDIWIVAVLAVVVTVAMIFSVRALRTASDGLSMTLAGLVGLVVTFGPAALVLL